MLQTAHRPSGAVSAAYHTRSRFWVATVTATLMTIAKMDAKRRRSLTLLRTRSTFSMNSPRQNTWITTFIAINGRLQA
jgi:hypothetical protein